VHDLFFSYFDGDLTGVQGMATLGLMLGMMSRLRWIERREEDGLPAAPAQA
jgi:hypothetical protein